jgi:hypothetical protein
MEVGCPMIKHPLDKWLSGTQSQFDHCGEQKNFLLLLGIELCFLGCPVCRTVTTLTELQVDFEYDYSLFIQCALPYKYNKEMINMYP